MEFDLTENETAAMLKIKKDTLQRWRRKGRFVEGYHYIKPSPRVIRFASTRASEALERLHDPSYPTFVRKEIIRRNRGFVLR